jgi:hypothetical protein
MTAPIRVQRMRTKGWRLPPNTVCVTRPGKWGNPYSVARVHSPPTWWGVFLRYPSIVERVGSSASEHGAQLEAVAKFLRDLERGTLSVSEEDVRRELRGKNLACFCPIGSPCHADVLLVIANGGAL